MLIKRRYPSHLQRLPIFQRVWFLPLFSLVAALCWVVTAASQDDKKTNGHPSRQQFTLSVEMPGNTSLRANALYIPRPGQRACPYQNPSLQFESPASNVTNHSDFSIPLSYELPDCHLDLSTVDFETLAFHGTDHRQRSQTNSGAIAIRDHLHKGVPGFPASGEKTYRALCDWQNRVANGTVTPEQMLTCYAADPQWQPLGDKDHPHHVGGALSRQELDGKRIRLKFKKNA